MASFQPHYLTFTPQTYHHPVHRFRSWPMQTTSQSHPHTHVREQPRNTYNHTYITFCLDKTEQPLSKSRQNNMHSVHTRPCRIYEQSGPNNKQQSTTHGNAPKGYGSYIRPKLIYSTRIHNILVQAHTPLQIIKALTATGWGKQKETLMDTYKAVIRPALEYASYVWSPIASSTSINKLQVMQNAALRTATGCSQDTTIQQLHDETLTLPIHEHLQHHASQYKHTTQHPSYPLHKHTTYFNTPRLKNTIFNNGCYTTNIPTDPHTVTTTDIKQTCAIYIHQLSLDS